MASLGEKVSAMELNQKLTELESEIKLLKNEVKETLLDIRETLLNHQNPFISTKSLTAIEEARVQTVAIQHEEPAPRVEVTSAEQKDVEPKENPVQESRTAHAVPTSLSHATPLSAPEPRPQENGVARGVLDLASIAALARWASNSISRVGRSRMETIVEIYSMIGGLPPGLDEVLLKLTKLADGDEPQGQVTMRECITVLVQIDSLLGEGAKSPAALLSLLLDDKEESYH